MSADGKPCGICGMWHSTQGHQDTDRDKRVRAQALAEAIRRVEAGFVGNTYIYVYEGVRTEMMDKALVLGILRDLADA